MDHALSRLQRLTLAGALQGIETVRRDGCPALVKMMEKSLRLLFTSRDLSQVCRCWLHRAGKQSLRLPPSQQNSGRPCHARARPPRESVPGDNRSQPSRSGQQRHIGALSLYATCAPSTCHAYASRR